MPTGYTADVQSGKTTDFPAFAMQCARAFGALVMMRDEPSDADIPEKQEISKYHIKRLTEETERLAELQSMTLNEATTARDVARTGGRNLWIQLLRDTLED